MPIDNRVARMRPEYDTYASTGEMLAHARQQADELGLDDYFVVDVDSHREPNAYWAEVLEYIENPVMRANSRHDLEVRKNILYVPGLPGPRIGHTFQGSHGRIAHQEAANEDVDASDVLRDVELCGRAMDAMSIDMQVVFPTTLLTLGMTAVEQAEGGGRLGV